MHFRTKVSAALVAAILALPAATAAEEKLTFKALDPLLLAALEGALTPDLLEKLGVDSFAAAAESLSVRVAPADCPDRCGEAVRQGMCLCQPEVGRPCASGETAVSRGGAAWCKTLPETVDIFASDGGLGTTRLSLASGGRGN